MPAFASLYDRLGLPFGAGAERTILAATSAGSGGADAAGLLDRLRAARPGPRPERSRSGATRWTVSAAGVSRTAARRLDGRANLGVWRERLSLQEAARIRELTADVATGFGYPSGNGTR